MTTRAIKSTSNLEDLPYWKSYSRSKKDHYGNTIEQMDIREMFDSKVNSTSKELAGYAEVIFTYY
ncbi:MAG: hypothetical protein E6772_08225 [Dysgonomonas sp.]|nr:hypothetical protein [Dysgonomonas sp.]